MASGSSRDRQTPGMATSWATKNPWGIRASVAVGKFSTYRAWELRSRAGSSLSNAAAWAIIIEFFSAQFLWLEGRYFHAPV